MSILILVPTLLLSALSPKSKNNLDYYNDNHNYHNNYHGSNNDNDDINDNDDEDSFVKHIMEDNVDVSSSRPSSSIIQEEEFETFFRIPPSGITSAVDSITNTPFMNTPSSSSTINALSAIPESVENFDDDISSSVVIDPNSNVNNSNINNDKNAKRNSHYSTTSSLSINTFLSEISTTFSTTSSTKCYPSSSSYTSSSSSSLLKVLSATTLFTNTIASILSMHNEELMLNISDSTELDKYHLLHERVSGEAEFVLRYIKKITTTRSGGNNNNSNGSNNGCINNGINSVNAVGEGGKSDDLLSECNQVLYDKLVGHSNRLVEAIHLFANFVQSKLPVMVHEECNIISYNSFNSICYLIYFMMYFC